MYLKMCARSAQFFPIVRRKQRGSLFLRGDVAIRKTPPLPLSFQIAFWPTPLPPLVRRRRLWMTPCMFINIFIEKLLFFSLIFIFEIDEVDFYDLFFNKQRF